MVLTGLSPRDPLGGDDDDGASKNHRLGLSRSLFKKKIFY
jgi:hypothetical protein